MWKKSSLKNRQKTFDKVSALLEEINKTIVYQGIKFDIRNEYAIEYLEQVADQYVKLVDLHIVYGKGHRKSTEQKHYDKLVEYTDKLKKYAKHINTCGDSRNSYSKTDTGATFFRMKRDYMGNDQLLPGYNIQLGLCDEYISVFDVRQYASDMDYFQPLMEKFHDTYNKYGRREEVYRCEDCSNCSHKENCSKAEGNRTIRLNQELTGYHQEVLNNLNSTKGALLRMNRSIQAEGAFGTIKWNRDYKRARRKGLKGVIFELSLISCGFNLHKYHLKRLALLSAA